jgi:hypothetical protein
MSRSPAAASLAALATPERWPPVARLLLAMALWLARRDAERPRRTRFRELDRLPPRLRRDLGLER